jgi:hypothetical protein
MLFDILAIALGIMIGWLLSWFQFWVQWVRYVKPLEERLRRLESNVDRATREVHG